MSAPPPRLFPKREPQPGECPKCGTMGKFYPWEGDDEGVTECPDHGLFIRNFAQMVANLPAMREPEEDAA